MRTVLRLSVRLSAIFMRPGGKELAFIHNWGRPRCVYAGGNVSCRVYAVPRVSS
jgi:hypothetical protein